MTSQQLFASPLRIGLALGWAIALSTACSSRSVEEPHLKRSPPPKGTASAASSATSRGPGAGSSLLSSGSPSLAGQVGVLPSSAAHAPESPPPQRDPDGNDDPNQPPSQKLPERGIFERVGRPPASLRQICDLTPLGDALYAAHALVPLGADGATITRYRPADEKRPFSIAFDWNRPGQPTQGGGAGQGFLRVRALDGRLFVPDADSPYAGFGLIDWGTESYLFVSSDEGRFAPAHRPNYRPPGRPSPDGKRSGAAILPRAYHVLDVIRFRGMWIASTGSVPPGERAWRGPSPGALHVATPDLSRFVYAVPFPFPYDQRVWRLTYLVRHRDRLLVGLQDYDGTSPYDYLIVDPPGDATTLEHTHLRPVRALPDGGAQTLRWYTDRGSLFWIAWNREGVALRVTRDQEHWQVISLPAEAGAPTDILRFGPDLVVLAEFGLYRLDDAWQPTVIATVPTKKSPFELRDGMCAAPLATFQGELYAGGQRDGALYRLVPAPEAPTPTAPAASMLPEDAQGAR